MDDDVALWICQLQELEDMLEKQLRLCRATIARLGCVASWTILEQAPAVAQQAGDLPHEVDIWSKLR